MGAFSFREAQVNGMDALDQVCRLRTDLSDDDVARIRDVARHLQLIADLTQANVFVDCPLPSGDDAVVVAEASPVSGHSLYSESVVGKIAFAAYEPAVARTHRTGEVTTYNRAITQEGKHVKQSVVPIKNDKGETIGSLILEQDISEWIDNAARVRVLSEAVEQLSHVFFDIPGRSPLSDVIQDALFLTDDQGRITYVNACGITLITEFQPSTHLIGERLDKVLPFIRGLQFLEGEAVRYETEVGKRVFQVHAVGLWDPSGTRSGLVMIREVSELREKERQLQIQSAMIKEIHHRVKNNLQAVASLLRLQMRRCPEDQQAHYRQTLNRIMSIAAVHEVLSGSRVEMVDFHDVVRKIGWMQIHSMTADPPRIRYEVRGARLVLPSGRAVSLALVANELIQNSLEHAYRDRTEGLLAVEIGDQESWALLQVVDDGCGFQEGQVRESLELQIVRTLTECDLGGVFHIQVRPEGGTVATVMFPKGETSDEQGPNYDRG